MPSRDRSGSDPGEDSPNPPATSEATRVALHAPLGWRPTGGKEPTSRTGRSDLPSRHRTEDPEHAEPPNHRSTRRPQRSEYVTPRRPLRLGHRHVHPSAMGHLQQPRPHHLQPAAHHPQPAPRRRHRNPKRRPDRPMPRPTSAGHQSRTNHLDRIRTPQQHRDRQQNMGDQTHRAARPPRVQHPRPAVDTARACPPPPPQHTGAIRAADLPSHQPRLDPNRISLYRHQRVPPCIQHGPPAAVPTTRAGGPLSSQLNLLDTLTVTTRQTNTPTRPPPPSATSTTYNNPNVVIQNDGQHRVLNDDLAADFARWHPGFTHHNGPVELVA